MKKLTQHVDELLGLFFPDLCVTCGERLLSHEKLVCFNCWNDLPKTNFQFEFENKVAQLFWGRVHIEYATSFFAYKKGSRYQQLIHYTKYKGLKELGFEVGRRFGFDLNESEAFQSVDWIVPVPLHPKKQKSRGYNQSEWIARGMAEAMQKKVSVGNLYRKIYTTTQTRKNRFERFQNVEGIFDVTQPEVFENKHILLIDDVVTTGSTLEACAIPLIKINNTRVSIATLAFADM